MAGDYRSIKNYRRILVPPSAAKEGTLWVDPLGSGCRKDLEGKGGD